LDDILSTEVERELIVKEFGRVVDAEVVSVVTAVGHDTRGVVTATEA